MFKELLDREFVLDRVRGVRDFLRDHLAAGGGDLEADGERASADEMRALLDHVELALQDAEEGLDAHSERDSRRAYLPRNATTSVIQSRLEQCVFRRIAELGGEGRVREIGRPAVLESDDPFNSRLPAVTDQSIPPEILAPAQGRREITGPYEPCDPKWLTIGAAMAWRKIYGQRAFNPAHAEQRLGESVRLFLFSDWATGIERAQRLSAAITKILRQEDSQSRDCHLIHLGDTYYAGWGKEQERHVLDIWPDTHGDLATSWALPGNHDYYSGGDGFFDRLLGDHRFTHQTGDGNPTSIFALANEHWRVIGLDTGWRDHDLADDQLSWLSAQLEAMKAQRPILLSHHQPWSAFTDDTSVNQLGEKIEPLLASNPAAAWFWGHEHRLALYQPTATIERPRLIGNGGVPEYVVPPGADDPAVLYDFQDEVREDHGDEHWCAFAFAVLDLNGDVLTESYYDEYANPIDTSA